MAVHALIGGQVEAVDGLGLAGAVLRAGEQVVPRVRVLRDVFAGCWVDVDQRGVAAPVLPAGVGLDDLGRDALRVGALQQAVAGAAERVVADDVGVRELVDRTREEELRGLSVASIELAADTAGDVDVHAVKSALREVVGVAVESEVEQMAEEAPALRDTEAVHALVRTFPTAQEERRVAEGEQSRAHDRRAVGGVDDLVDLARREAVGEPEMAVAFDDARVGRLGEAPLVAGNLAGLVVLEVADVEPRATVFVLGDGVSGLAEMLDRHRGDSLAGTQVGDRLAGDGHSVLKRLRCVEAEQRVHVGRVPLPSDRGEAESVSKEEAVARIERVGKGELAGSLVESARQQRAAAVGHVDNERAIAGVQVLRANQDKVARIANAAVRPASCEVKVGDALVIFKRRVDRIVEFARGRSRRGHGCRKMHRRRRGSGR